MKLTLQKLLEIKPSLEKLVTKDIPIKSAFKFGKLIQRLNQEYTVFEENKKKLFDKYGEKKEENKIEIKKENIEVFNKDMLELFGIEVDIEFEKTKLKDLGDITISALDMATLDIFIEE